MTSTRKNLEIIILSKVHQKEKDKYQICEIEMMAQMNK